MAAVTALGSQALRNSPGVGTFYAGENGATSTGDSIYMRGFDSSSSIFVDGVRDLGAVSRDLFNIEQVEVVKGPAGTDTGRSAATVVLDNLAVGHTARGEGTGHRRHHHAGGQLQIAQAEGREQGLNRCGHGISLGRPADRSSRRWAKKCVRAAAAAPDAE